MHYLVVNPVAGRGRARRALTVAESYLAQHAMPSTVLETEGPGHAEELVRALPGDARVVVLGGDGTVHSVAAACVDSARTVGIVPSGSGDDLAFALGIDRRDTRAALDRIRKGAVRYIDVGAANGVPFVNAMGMGFDADVAAKVRGAPGVLHGLAAYLYALVAALKDFRLGDVRVEIDGGVVHAGPSLLVATQNGPRTGGSFLMAPEARIDDGILEVLVAGRFTRAGALAVVPRLMNGTHLDHPEVRAFRGERVRLTWSSPRPFHMEGELAGPVQTAEISIRPRALRVFA